jgi:hypothetical protein
MEFKDTVCIFVYLLPLNYYFFVVYDFLEILKL